MRSLFGKGIRGLFSGCVSAVLLLVVGVALGLCVALPSGVALAQENANAATTTAAGVSAPSTASSPPAGVNQAGSAENRQITRTTTRWLGGYLIAEGQAVAPQNAYSEAQGQVLARLGAKVDAERALAEMLYGVVVDSNTTVVNLMANDVVRTRVSGLIKNAQPVEGSESWDGKVYRVKLRLWVPTLMEDLGIETFRPAGTATRESPYSGLIIDARGKNLTPQLFVTIVDEKGNVVYDVSQVYHDVAVQMGMAEFRDGVSNITGFGRAGDHPLIVKAAATRGKYNSEIVVSNADAAKIRELFSDTRAFAEARVVVLMD